MPTPNDFSDFRFQANQNTGGGDFSPTADAPAAPEVSAGVYPNSAGYGFEPGNRQFTSREEFATEEPSVPEILLESTRAGVEAHASMNEAYGLCQPMATLGSHPWLRDSLADPSEYEPGNAEPAKGMKVPFEERQTGTSSSPSGSEPGNAASDNQLGTPFREHEEYDSL